MHKILILIIICTTIGCTKQQREVKHKSREEREYKGVVKRIIEYECDKYFKNDGPINIDKGSCGKVLSIIEFDTSEIILKKDEWYTDAYRYPGEPNKKYTCKIDSKGNIIEKHTILRDEWRPKYMAPQESKFIYSYNSDGFVTEEICYTEETLPTGKFFWREENIYDEYNCLIKSIMYDENNKIKYYHTYTYDSNNNKIKDESYNPDDKLIRTTEYQYDKNDKTTKRIEYDGEGKLIAEHDYNNIPEEIIEKFSNGNVKVKSHKITMNDRPNGKIITTYDIEGRKIEQKEFDINGKWRETLTWKYREDGALLEESKSAGYYGGISYKKWTTYYTLDDKGNWIEKYMINEKGEIVYLGGRTIDYY